MRRFNLFFLFGGEEYYFIYFVDMVNEAKIGFVVCVRLRVFGSGFGFWCQVFSFVFVVRILVLFVVGVWDCLVVVWKLQIEKYKKDRDLYFVIDSSIVNI